MVSLETLINNLDEAIFLFNGLGRLIYINKTAEEFFGKSLKEIKNKRFKDLFASAKDVAMLIQKTLHEGRSFNCKDMEIDIGRMVTVDLNLTPFHVDNSLEGVILCIREQLALTEREDYQFDLLLYLLGSISHEVKNPLSGIKGAAQILKASAQNEEALECTKLIVKEADRLNSVLHSYLTMTRKPVLNQMNVHEVIEHALRVMALPIKEKKIRLEKFYDPSLPQILGDESKLLQVVINLLKNAVEAMNTSESPKILNISTCPSDEYMVIHERDGPDKRLAMTKKQRWVIINIKDTGEGIAREEISKIFLPYFTRKEGGSGLGLALSKKIVKDHGGILKVKSRLGRGTTFSIYLPYR